MRTGQTASLATALVVREESLTLYGFADEDERQVFETVQTVSGFGPRLALAMLAVHSPDAVRGAITTGDLVALTKVPGIGRQGRRTDRPRAARQDRHALGRRCRSATVRHRRPGRARCARPWSGWGWTVRQADDAVEAVTPLAADGATVSALLKAALQELGR